MQRNTISIFSLYEYVFRNKAKTGVTGRQLAVKKHKKLSPKNPDLGINKKPARIFSQEYIDNKIADDALKHKNQKISELGSLLDNDEFARAFRKFLREIKSIYLETLLFGNNTDDLENSTLHSRYVFPNEAVMKKIFDEWEDTYHIFSDNRKTAQAQFNIFFVICKIIADAFEKNNDERNYVAAEHAYKMLALFGYNLQGNPFGRTEEFLKKNQCYQFNKPIHDTLSTIQLPHIDRDQGEAICDLKGWQDFILEYERGIQYFPLAVRIEQALHRAPKNQDEALMVVANPGYKHYSHYPDLAKYCLQYHVPEETFDKCLEIEKNRKTSDKLPDVSVNGKDVGHEGYHLVKLPYDDPRATILGKMTGCCQSVGGNGEKCVIDGITREHNGFYVLLKGKSSQEPLINGKINPAFNIVGQGYAWISHDKEGLVFDSWENLRREDDKIIYTFLKESGKRVTAQTSLLRVSIGTGGKTPQVLKQKKRLFPDRMLEGSQYGDSLEQSLIYLDQTKLTKCKQEFFLQWEKLQEKPFGMSFEEFSSFMNFNKFESRSDIQFIQEQLLCNGPGILKDILKEEIVYSLKDKTPKIRGLIFKNLIILIQQAHFNDESTEGISLLVNSWLSLSQELNDDHFRYYCNSLNAKASFLPELKRLVNENLLSPDFYKRVITNIHCFSEILVDTLIRMGHKDLLTIAHLELFYKPVFYQDQAILAIIELDKHEILTNDDFHALFQVPDDEIESFATYLIALRVNKIISDDDLKFLVNENCIGLINKKYPLNEKGIPLLVASLKKLKDAGLLNDTNINNIKNTLTCKNQDEYDIIDCWIRLQKANLLDDDIYKLIISKTDRKEITDNLIDLHNEKILTPEIRQIILYDTYGRNNITKNLLQLNKAGLFTKKYIDLLQQVSDISDKTSVVSGLVQLKEAGLLEDKYIAIMMKKPRTAATVVYNLIENKQERDNLITLCEQEINRLRTKKSNLFYWSGTKIKVSAYNQVITALRKTDLDTATAVVLDSISNDQVHHKDKGGMRWISNETIEDSNAKTADKIITVHDALMWSRNSFSLYSSDSAEAWKKIRNKFPTELSAEIKTDFRNKI